MKTTKIHGLRIIAFAKTEEQSGKDCGIVLVQTRPGIPGSPNAWEQPEWMISWYRDGDSEWANGAYRSSNLDAWKELMRQAELYGATEITVLT